MATMIDLEDRSLKGFLMQTFFLLLVLFLVYLVIFRYYGGAYRLQRENPRFVNVNYTQLEVAANSLEIDTSAVDKTAKNVFVLNYHVITKGPPMDEYEISYEQFRDNMFALKSHGYQTITMQDFYLFMRGEKQLPDKSFLLTFDDGAKSTYYNGDPILRALNYSAVMFVITGASLDGTKRSYYLNQSELYEAHQTGRWELESHTDKSHFRLPIDAQGNIGPALTNKLWIANETRLETDDEYFIRVSDDLKKAKDLLETDFNKTVIGFALPFGDFGEQGSNYPEAHNILYNLTTELYKVVFYQFSSAKPRYYRGNYNDLPADSYVVVRLSVDALRTPEQLLTEIEASRAIDLPYTEDYTNIDRWSAISGKISFDANKIIMRDDPNANPNIKLAYLDGSYLLKDYTYSVQLDNLTSTSVLLISRLKTSSDYVACRYKSGSIKVINVEKGGQTTMGESLISQNMTSNSILSMSVSGLNVTCSMDGMSVLTAEVPQIPPYGGVGIKAEGFEGEDKTFVFGNIQIVENPQNEI